MRVKIYGLSIYSQAAKAFATEREAILQETGMTEVDVVTGEDIYCIQETGVRGLMICRKGHAPIFLHRKEFERIEVE